MVLAGVSVLASSAQTDPQNKMQEMRVQIEKMLTNTRVLGVEGAVMGATVKGAPYSGDEVRETSQVLGDGTRIHSENKSTVYRDSEGRTRRETPTQIDIWDPVAGTAYMLDPKNMTYSKMNVHIVVRHGDGVNSMSTYTFSSTGPAPDLHAMPPEMGGQVTLGLRGGSIDGPGFPAMMGGPDAFYVQKMSIAKPKKETLGTRTIEGVNCDGERSTSTIEAGAIGNDRPISTVSERWYSPELQLTVQSTKTDPRTGDENFKLTNIRRGEPDPTLFSVPSNYQQAGPVKF
jgi:hypothetical protein